MFGGNPMKGLLGSRLPVAFAAFLIVSVAAFADNGYTPFTLAPLDGQGATGAADHNLMAAGWAWIGPMPGLSGQAIRGGAMARAWNTPGTECAPGRRCAPARIVAVRIVIVRPGTSIIGFFPGEDTRETFRVRFRATRGANGLLRASFGLGLRNLSTPLRAGDKVVVEVDAVDADGGSVTDLTTYLVQ